MRRSRESRWIHRAAAARLPGGTTVSRDAAAVEDLKKLPGKDIAIFGGGTLFRSVLEAKLADTVEVAVIPVLLGQVVPLMPGPDRPVPLTLTSQKVFAATGTLLLGYTIGRAKTRRRKS